MGEEFVRIKYGIGKAKSKEETNRPMFLENFLQKKKRQIKESLEKIFNLIDDIKNDMDISKLMNKYNKK